MATDTHPCVADGCGIPLPPHQLMCRPHWARVLRVLQARIYALYRPGQTALTATPENLQAVREAVAAARETEIPHA